MIVADTSATDIVEFEPMSAEKAIVPATQPSAIVEIVAPLDFDKLKDALEKFQRGDGL